MAASPVLVDSSFYIRQLRQGQDPLPTLALAAATRDLAVCPIVRCEVGRALRDLKAVKRFRAFWDVMINVPTDHRLWEEVERMLWNLDRHGVMLPLTDVVIGCCAVRIKAVILTGDGHFNRIPGVRPVDRLEE